MHRPPNRAALLAGTAALIFAFAGFLGNIVTSQIPRPLQPYTVLSIPLFIIFLVIAFVLQTNAGKVESIGTSALEPRYEFQGHAADAVRLVGAADEYFPIHRLEIEFEDDIYRLPDELLVRRDDEIKRLDALAAQTNSMFYDGPNTRLLDYRATPIDDTEETHLKLRLGPIGWFDYSVIQSHLDSLPPKQKRLWTRRYVDVPALIDSGDVKCSRLSNILCTGTTVVTFDGHVLFSRRSSRVSSQQLRYTTCIAENIHREKDGVYASTLSGGLPPPYRTVIRGAEEELSPRIADEFRTRPEHVQLLGIGFDWSSLHPDLYFLAIWPGTVSAFLQHCREKPGKHFVEGSTQVVALDRRRIAAVLTDGEWVEGGKAAFIRAIEFIGAVHHQHGGTITAALEQFIDRARAA